MPGRRGVLEAAVLCRPILVLFDLGASPGMRNLPVHWSEGMFLRPHHFQAADRHWREQLATSSRWDNSYGYGLHRCEVSTEALANYQVQVTGLQCRLGDGTIFSVGDGHELDRRDLKAAFAAGNAVTVYLAIPKLVLGRPNVSTGRPAEPARYIALETQLQDEAAGANDQDVSLMRLDGRLMLSTEDLHGYEALPIARIRRA